MNKTRIIINTQFPALHCWKDCNLEEVSYLTYPHRHIFHVCLKIEVAHPNRDIEFISMKNKVEEFIAERYWNNFLENKSCEMIAGELLKEFSADYVSVLEDGENGSEVHNV